MRAIWKGVIQFSLVNIPVKLYGAIDNDATISFRQLHKTDHEPVGYKKVCKGCGTELATEDIVKGYEYEPNQYVIIEDNDLNNVKLKSTKVIEIEAFVDAEEVPRTLFDTPYYIGPDGQVGASPFQLILETLRTAGKLAIGRVVLRDREHAVMIAPHENGLLLYKLRFPAEVRQVDAVPTYPTKAVNPAQVELATQLVNSMVKPFSELELKDRYQDALVEMIRAKIEGREIVTTVEKPEPAMDIMSALKASIESAKAIAA